MHYNINRMNYSKFHDEQRTIPPRPALEHNEQLLAISKGGQVSVPVQPAATLEGQAGLARGRGRPGRPLPSDQRIPSTQ